MGINQEIFELIDAFIDNEMALADYYRYCMDKFPENREKWERLMLDETKHAEIFKKIRILVEASPFKWKMGRYQVQTVRLICNSVKQKIEEMKQGKLNPRYAVNFIADVEQSLIESDIARSLYADDAESQNLLAKVQGETVGHKQLLLSMVK